MVFAKVLTLTLQMVKSSVPASLVAEAVLMGEEPVSLATVVALKHHPALSPTVVACVTQIKCVVVGFWQD